MRLPKIDSATWRGIITGLQVLLGFSVGLLALPEFRELVQQFYPQAVPLIVTLSGLVSFLFNFLRRDVDNY